MRFNKLTSKICLGILCLLCFRTVGSPQFIGATFFMGQKEVWKPAFGLEGRYEVSTFGNVKSVDRFVKNSKGVIKFHKGRILIPQVNAQTNYLQFAYAKGKHLTLHRAVALTFIPNPENKKTVNHKDLNRQNNRVENLEWATHTEQLFHARENGHNLKYPKFYKNRNKIIQSFISGKLSSSEIIQKYNIPKWVVQRILKGKDSAYSKRNKLSKNDIMKMFELRKQGLLYKEIALKFNVNWNLVQRYCYNYKKFGIINSRSSAEIRL